MTMYGYLWIVGGLFAIGFFLDSFDIGNKISLLFFCVLVSFIGYKVYYNTTDEAFQEIKKEKQAEVEVRSNELKPRLVSESDDGCKIYTFKPDSRWLYYTVCPNKSTTLTNEWVENCGKGCTKVVQSPIEVK